MNEGENKELIILYFWPREPIQPHCNLTDLGIFLPRCVEK